MTSFLLVCLLTDFALFLGAVGNHTGRIKVVFTPTICKLTCVGGRCHNNCERGNTTTIISENGHATDTLTAPNFRVVVCHLPCINGGKCSARDKCQCPPNFTGKFCQMPVQNGHQQHQQTAGGYGQTQVHSTHTLPLTYSNGQSTVYSPNIVNIHIKHPPEASVQVHQVSQLDSYHNNGHQIKGSQSGSSSSSTSYTYHHADNQVPQYQPVTSKNMLGRCFQETTGSQCGKALPGLTKQEHCCGTIGTSWGFHKCQKCPKKPSTPVIACPQGYKRVNISHCQDLDECQLQGVCPNGMCVNTMGSFRCMCAPGYVPDPTFTSCIPETPAVQEEKGACFRLVSKDRACLHPITVQLSKQLCCCTVGKAWGPHCDKCPPPGTAQFKEICPGGKGYTVLPNPPVNKPVTVYQPPPEPIQPQPLPTPERPVEAFGRPEEIIPGEWKNCCFVFSPKPPSVFPEVDECQVNPYICGQGICYNTAVGYTCHCNEGFHLDHDHTTCVDVDECVESPSKCTGGLCRNTEGSFLCVCPRGFHADAEGTSCVDIDECVNRSSFSDIDECVMNRSVCPSGLCFNVPGSFNCASCPNGRVKRGEKKQRQNVFTILSLKCNGYGFPTEKVKDIDECQDQRLCTRGHCLNTEGSFICECGPGFRESATGEQCDGRMLHHFDFLKRKYVDECAEETRPCGSCYVDECVNDPELCSPNGECLNTEGSFLCVCDRGFTAGLNPPSCEDVDECGLNETLCGSHGFCENRLGSFVCLCDQGYQETLDGQGCVDVNECDLLSSVCGEAQCVNMDGSFLCMCPSGQEYNTMSTGQNLSSVERKECYFHLNDENLCESVLTSHVTLQECCCTLGAGWGDNCEVHPCPVNGTDQFDQMCPSGRGFIPSVDLSYGQTHSYKDADECTLFGVEVCKGGFCLDTVGSYECYCKTGQDYDPVRLECTDIDECLDESVCVGGQCLNTDGSYMCFCTHPMVLDPSGNHCVFLSDGEQIDYQGICWQRVTDTLTCTEPLGQNRKSTYTECCCLYGEAWGMDCALCPSKHTDDYARMCNLPMGGGGGYRPYGRDALTADQYKPFEGLRAEECGILNGCENGRCVRVQEGYTCDCFDGYTLDLSRMACIDVNECSELNSRMSLCKNAKCINTIGSYQCVCLPGFMVSDKPNYCVEAASRHTSHTSTRRQ
uniref:Latent transforming growth factor beta binding protein 1 n=1 Tax=Cynoglossus semilaevis TaxID=244447 RepID=A0A3P8WHA4_CYNSE